MSTPIYFAGDDISIQATCFLDGVGENVAGAALVAALVAMDGKSVAAGPVACLPVNAANGVVLVVFPRVQTASLLGSYQLEIQKMVGGLRTTYQRAAVSIMASADLGTIPDPSTISGSIAITMPSPLLAAAGKSLVLAAGSLQATAPILAGQATISAAAPAIAQTNFLTVSNSMTVKNYAGDEFFNPDGGGANFRAVLVTKIPHGRTNTSLKLLVGACGAGLTPDRYKLAWAQDGWGAGNNPAAWTECAYPGGLSYVQPATPTQYGDLTGVWIDAPIAPVGFDAPIQVSVEALGLGRWTSCGNLSTQAWYHDTLCYNQFIDSDATVSGSFTPGLENISMGIVAWGFEVSGAPVYGIARTGDSLSSNVRPQGSTRDLCLEGPHHYANLYECANGLKLWFSTFANGTFSQDDYTQRGRSIVPLILGKASIMDFPIWTYNQSPASLQDALDQQAAFEAFAAELLLLGITVVPTVDRVQGSARRSAGWDAGYDSHAAYAQAHGIYMADTYWDPADHRNWNPAYSDDFVHQNEAAAIVGGPVYAAKWRAWFAAKGITL